jgi:hypothetical protein
MGTAQLNHAYYYVKTIKLCAMSQYGAKTNWIDVQVDAAWPPAWLAAYNRQMQLEAGLPSTTCHTGGQLVGSSA